MTPWSNILYSTNNSSSHTNNLLHHIYASPLSPQPKENIWAIITHQLFDNSINLGNLAHKLIPNNLGNLTRKWIPQPRVCPKKESAPLPTSFVNYPQTNSLSVTRSRYQSETTPSTKLTYPYLPPSGTSFNKYYAVSVI